MNIIRNVGLICLIISSQAHAMEWLSDKQNAALVLGGTACALTLCREVHNFFKPKVDFSALQVALDGKLHNVLVKDDFNQSIVSIRTAHENTQSRLIELEKQVKSDGMRMLQGKDQIGDLIEIIALLMQGKSDEVVKKLEKLAEVRRAIAINYSDSDSSDSDSSESEGEKSSTIPVDNNFEDVVIPRFATEEFVLKRMQLVLKTMDDTGVLKKDFHGMLDDAAHATGTLASKQFVIERLKGFTNYIHETCVTKGDVTPAELNTLKKLLKFKLIEDLATSETEELDPQESIDNQQTAQPLRSVDEYNPLDLDMREQSGLLEVVTEEEEV